MKRVFLSFRAENKKQVDGIRLMAWNDRFDLEFYDESVQTPYNSENAPYIKNRISEKINRCSLCVCLLDAQTFTSSWVNWEVETAVKLGKRVILMILPGVSGAVRPPPAAAGAPIYQWDPKFLTQLIEATR